MDVRYCNHAMRKAVSVFEDFFLYKKDVYMYGFVHRPFCRGIDNQ